MKSEAEEQEQFKRCARCREIKPASSFNIDRQKRSGLTSYCKSCIRSHNHSPKVKLRRQMRTRARVKMGIAKKQGKERYLRNRDRILEASRQRYRRDALKFATRRKTVAAINSGVLKKRPCEVCGWSEVEAHHNDYNDPMNITWMCLKHHKAWHTLFLAEEPQEVNQ